LAEAIDDLLNTFYETPLEDVKYHLEYNPKHPSRMDDSAFTLPELEKIPKSFDEEFRALLRDYFVSKPIIELDATATSNRKVWIVVDSKGTRVIQKQDLMRFTIDPYGLSSRKRVFTDGVYRMAFTFDELIKEFPNAKHDLQQFLYTLERKQLPSDIYPLIFDHSAVATLFHEAIAGHMLSGYYIVDEISTIFKGKLNKSVARDDSMAILKKLQIWDCPLEDKMLAHYEYDMEGVPAKNVLLIDHGVVKNFLHDRYSAARMKKTGNGHALSEDFQEKTLYNFMLRDSPRLPEPRVSNLKVLSDSTVTFEDLENYYFKKYGFYIFVKSYSGEVDVSTGTFKLKVDSLTKVYANGRKEYFHGGVFSSNLTDFISAVKEVSNSYGFAAGFCGSGSGSVPTHEYTPAMSVHGINWAPYPLPDKLKKWSNDRDKYVPNDWIPGDTYEI
jgi:predicted Zn-dependent protease